MTTFSLDSSVVIAWILQENQRWRSIDRILTADGADPVLPAPGLAEVIATVRRKGNTTSPQGIALALNSIGIRTELMGVPDLVRAAELYERSSAHPGSVNPRTGIRATLSWGDCLILSIAERLGTQIVTLDRYWSIFAQQGHTSARIVQL